MRFIAHFPRRNGDCQINRPKSKNSKEQPCRVLWNNAVCILSTPKPYNCCTSFLNLVGHKPSYVTWCVFKSRCKNSSSIEQEHSQACPVYTQHVMDRTPCPTKTSCVPCLHLSSSLVRPIRRLWSREGVGWVGRTEFATTDRVKLPQSAALSCNSSEAWLLKCEHVL